MEQIRKENNMYNILILLLCLMIGIVIGAFIVLINRWVSIRRKTVKQYAFKDRDRDKKIVADSRFLKSNRKEYASDEFRQ